MDLQKLNVFFLVAKSGSFTKAALKLGVQQPAVSRSVQQLEIELGYSLFLRDHKQIQLTEAGKDVFQLCSKAFGTLDEINQIAERNNEHRGDLQFAASDTISSDVVAPFLSEFLIRYQKIIPTVFAGSSRQIQLEVIERRSEFGIQFTMPYLPGLKFEKLADVPFYLVASVKNSKPTLENFIGKHE